MQVDRIKLLDILECKTLKATLKGMSRPMVLHSNKLDNYSVYCKCMNLSEVSAAKLSIKLLRLIQSAYYHYKSLTTDNYEE